MAEGRPTMNASDEELAALEERTQRLLPAIWDVIDEHRKADPDLTGGAIISALTQIIAVCAAKSSLPVASVDRFMHELLDEQLNAARLAVSKEGGTA